jgi:murein DD-endopeptidase MepM/ murein hydrolase activator NlpD
MRKFLYLLVLLLIIGIPTYIYTSSTFERKPPIIEIKHDNFWNLRDKFEIDISDSSGIKYYKVTLINDKKADVLIKKSIIPSEIKQKVKIDLKLPQFYTIKGDTIILKIEAVDNSKWNYFAGNEIEKEIQINIDTSSPNTEVINNNYAMKRGGSGIAIVKVEDKNLKEAYIKISQRDNEKNFIKLKLTPFYKEGYFVSFLVWPYEYSTFSADLIAIDKAGNISQSHIPIRWKKVKYPKANIKIGDNFIKQIAVPLLNRVRIAVPSDAVDIFKEVNEKLRKIDEKELYQITNVMLDKKIDNIYINPFRPMKGYAKKASFGEVRTYYYQSKKISQAIHKGLDIASFRHAKVYASNKGKVIYRDFVGIYGNTLALYHLLGLVSTYSHCSGFNVDNNQFVHKGQLIAHTGSTGAVFGDHLHFGVYIQGIPVEPLEWMDGHWIKDNITNVIIKAKRIINR